MGYDIHGDNKSGAEGLSLIALFKAGVGTLLILTGASLGIYIAVMVFGLIAGNDPPKLVANFASEQVKGSVELPANNEKVQFEVSPNVLQTVIYVLTFLLLTIPTTIAGGMVKAGAGLMNSDSVIVMKQLVEKLRRAQ